MSGGGALRGAHSSGGQRQPAGGFGRPEQVGERGQHLGAVLHGSVPVGLGLLQVAFGVRDPVVGFQDQHVCLRLGLAVC